MYSLRDKIVNAKSKDEVEACLQEGKTYKYASTKTIRRWRAFAQKKISSLSAETVAEQPKVEVKKTPKVKKVKTSA